jgi:hypothetical protein
VNRVVNRAAHHAAMQQMMRRRASFVIVPPPPQPTTEAPTNSVGLEVAREWTITEATLDDGLVHYELTEGDEVLWSGVGDDPAEGLLQIIMRIVDGADPDQPND